MKLLISTISFCFSITINAQCGYVTEAILSGDTLHCSGDFGYENSVTYHPQFELYYTLNSGSGAAEEIFDIDGILLGNASNVDWRGMWHNPTNNTIEGNVWGSYLQIDSLLPNGFLGGTVTGVTNLTPPDNQAIGAYDFDNNEVLYYLSGMIFGENRTTGVDIPTLTLLNNPSPISDIVSLTMIYTGCAGKEIGLYDRNLNRLLFFNKVNGEFTGMVNMPVGTPTLVVDGITGGKFAFANDKVWLHYESISKWVGYTIFDENAGIEEIKANVFTISPNPATDFINLSVSQSTSITITTSTGQIIRELELDGNSTIDVSNFTSGIYFIKTSDGQTNKLIKE